MANECDEYDEAAVLNDAHAIKLVVSQADVALLDDVLAQGVAIAVADTGVFDDAQIVSGGPLMADSAVLNDAHTAMVASEYAYAEAAVLDDVVISARLDTIAEAAVLNDATAVAVAHLIAEVAVLNDTYAPHTVARISSNETAILDDRVISARIDTTAESAVADDAHQGTTAAIAASVEAAVADDAHTAMAAVLAETAEAGVLDDVYTATAAAIVSVLEEAWLNDVLWQVSSGIAWTAASETLGVSKYEGVPFVAAASIGGELVGILDTGGAYALAADDDDGEPIAWRISTGMLDFGKDVMKRPEAVYVGYTAQAPIMMALANTQSGREVEYEYELPDRLADVPGAARFKPGHGVLSRYYRLTLSSDDAQFALHSLRAVFLDTSRRV